MGVVKGVAACLVVASLAGCEGITAANESTARLSGLTAEEKERQRAAMRGEVHRVDRPYFGEAVQVQRGSTKGRPLPKEVEGARSFRLTGAPLKIGDLAQEITDQTELVVQVRTKYLTPDGGALEIPIGGTVKLAHEGSLSSALDKVSALLDVEWSFDGTTILIDRMVTRDYQVSLPTGSSSMQTSLSGVNGGSRSVQMTRNIAEFSAWDDLEARLTRAVPPPGNVELSKSAGRVSVFGPPSVQKAAAAVVEDFEQIYSVRIGLEVAVYFVDADKSDDFGVGLNLSETSGSTTIGLLGAAGVLTGNGVATLSRGSSQVNFRALARDSSVVDYRVGSTIAQSGVISPIILTRSQNYVSRATTTTTDGIASTAIETATVDEGISIHALPRLIGPNKIQLSLTLLQNDLTSLDTFDSGSSTVQLPTIDQRAIQNEAVLSPGETLVLSGYEQESASRSNQGAGSSRFLGLGGSANGSKRKIRMVVLVRPAIIPAGRS